MPQDKSIPYDIYQEIFSHISDDDKATLSACSQLAPCFREPMQERLFKSIELEYTERSVEDLEEYHQMIIVWADEIEESKSKMLLRALESNPKLTEYIKELKITISPSPGIYEVESLLGDKTITFDDLVTHITHLTSLSVICRPSPVTHEAYSRPLKAAIKQLLARNANLTSVNLSGIFQFAIAELQHLQSSVKSLTLARVSNRRFLLPGENVSSPEDQDGVACTPTSLCIIDPGRATPFVGALQGEVEIRDEDTYYIYRYKRRTPYLSFSQLESLEIPETASVNDIRGLLSFADPNKLRRLCLQTPSLSFTTHSLVFDDNEAPGFELTHRGDGADPRFNSYILDLTDFTRLESFQMHGDMHYIQGTTMVSPEILTHIPWVTQVIERLPRPDNVVWFATCHFIIWCFKFARAPK
ncbi:hypothetical protein CVT24_008086 [Panaeolus cyanescens]|uniref:F-box domain-containing protein n=1 Tax=Panaeolus cyanescens TaxID=181874 RepID=A0A409W0L7_9AGAR|nr:hypothetical protein CVT24_008086 [Panaeolus cyanescens]